MIERFPGLHFGVIEQGAIWVPSWMRQMESAFEAFLRHEERLQACRCAQRVRPPPGPLHALSDRGRGLDHASRRAPTWCLFSSDYPHVEGGRKPLERFEASLGDAVDEVRRQFYTDNFLFLMGSAATALAA